MDMAFTDGSKKDDLHCKVTKSHALHHHSNNCYVGA